MCFMGKDETPLPPPPPPPAPLTMEVLNPKAPRVVKTEAKDTSGLVTKKREAKAKASKTTGLANIQKKSK